MFGVDILITDDDKLYINEINHAPGFPNNPNDVYKLYYTVFHTMYDIVLNNT